MKVLNFTNFLIKSDDFSARTAGDIQEHHTRSMGVF